MGYETDLTSRAGIYKYHAEALQAFNDIRRQAEFARRSLPTHRELLQSAQAREFGPDP